MIFGHSSGSRSDERASPGLSLVQTFLKFGVLCFFLFSFFFAWWVDVEISFYNSILVEMQSILKQHYPDENLRRGEIVSYSSLTLRSGQLRSRNILCLFTLWIVFQFPALSLSTISLRLSGVGSFEFGNFWTQCQSFLRTESNIPFFLTHNHSLPPSFSLSRRLLHTPPFSVSTFWDGSCKNAHSNHHKETQTENIHFSLTPSFSHVLPPAISPSYQWFMNPHLHCYTGNKDEHGDVRHHQELNSWFLGGLDDII